MLHRHQTQYLLPIADSDFDFYIEAEANVSKIDHAMYALMERFYHFEPVRNARVPILKCVHIPTGYPCDLNFSDPLGCFNSRILGVLLHFDPRISLLASIIKAWMKIHECCGRYMITNYTAMWMLVFYLQQLPEPLLPPLSYFQANIPAVTVRGFNVAFNTNIPNLTKNRDNIMDLLRGFFDFYSKFDFKSNIICPLYGLSVAKDTLHTQRAPALKQLYDLVKSKNSESSLRLTNSICVQDPIEVTHICSGPIAKETFRTIFRKFGLAADFIAKYPDQCKHAMISIFDYDTFERVAKEKADISNAK